jgi:hypothetical protein
MITVQTCERDRNNGREEAIRQTWVQDCEDIIFYLGRPDQKEDYILEGDTLFMKCPDDGENSFRKRLMFLKWSVNNIKDNYTFKCDCDTYVDPKRLMQIDLKGADYAGLFRYPTPNPEPFCHFADGGAGVFLSKKAAEILSNTPIERCKGSGWNEDFHVGYFLKLAGIPLLDISRHLNPVSKPDPKEDSFVATCHHVSPEQMKEIYYRVV